mgnify:CR=1 FL=1
MAENYEKAGVNLEAGYEVVRRIKQHVASTARKGTMGNIGAFGGMFDLGLLVLLMHRRPAGDTVRIYVENTLYDEKIKCAQY